ncbi:MAG: hypothetical protein FWF07_02545, partial [Methanomassiliicoccaceae archaeon]|nr:hypothetical protein [Methanomassiliicoccaceae archaeon]
MSREKADVGRRSFSKTSKRPSNTLLITLAFLAVVILSVSVIAVHASNENTMGGDTPSQTGSISGLVWVDGNGSPATAGDGLYNGNEKPLAGFTVLLYNADDLTSAIAAAQTSSGGTYTFSGLGPGSYVVGIASETVNGTQYLLPWSVTSDNKFTIDTSTYDAAYSDTIQLSDGQNVTGINAGMGLPMSLAAPAGADYTCAIASDGFGFEVTGASTGNSPSDHRLPLQDAINWIKTDAAGNNCTITFMAILQSTMDLGTSTMTFSGTGWGTVTLKGTSSLTLTSSLNTVGQTILGVINVSDGVTVNCQVNITVSGNASVINNTSGTVNISAGTLQNTGGGRAISNFGTMSVSGTAVVQTPTTAVTLYNDNNGTVNISGGTVKNTYNTGTSGLSTGSASAAINNNAGELNISGGVVSSVYGSAIVNATTGGFTNINISGSAQVSSNYVNAIFLLNRPLTVFGGTVTSASEICTVYIVGTGTMTVAGGTVSNTGVGSAIQFESTAKATIMGGTVKATANNAINNVYGTIEVFGGTVQGGNITGYGVNNSADCAMVLGGGPIITGGIFVTPGKLSVSTSGNIFAPGGNKYGVTLSSYSEGAIVAANGHGYISNFSLMEDSGYILVDDGTNLILGTGLVQDVQYVDVNGETKTHDAMILTQAMFDDMLMVSPTNVVYILDQSYYDLSGGWFLINENITLVGNYNSRSVVNFDMMSDTRLIIANGITMTVNCQSIQATNCNLSVYSQPGDGSNTGVLTVMSIGVGGNAHTFINTAYINAGINMSGTSAMTVNGVTGTIKSGFNAYGIVISLGSSLTVNNYGTINGASSGVRMEAYATVNNFATGSFYPGDDTLYGTFPATYRGIIQGAVNGVDLAAGGTLDNYGGITSSGTATSYGGVYT